MNIYKWVIGLLAFGILTSQTFAIKESRIIRIGYIEYSKVVAKAFEDRSLIQNMEKVKKSFEERIANTKTDIASLENSLDNGSGANNAALNEMIVNLQNKKIELNLLIIQYQAQMVKEGEKMASLKEHINTVIAQKAKMLGFDIILDSSVVMVADKNLDITNTVMLSL